MTGPGSNGKLCRARAKRDDEFYTQYGDVEAELARFKQHFQGRRVLCSCDDPAWSAFWRYFHLNFGKLGLAGLSSTYYQKDGDTYLTEYTGGNDSDILAGERTRLAGDGDFRSRECMDILDACDIVVTNPPFSCFRDFLKALMEHGKKFLVIGNINCVTYKEIFPLIRDGRIWLGANAKGGTRKGNTMWFGVPDSEELVQVSAWWLTNLDHGKRHEKLELSRQYVPEDYPEYDNYDAIDVGRTADIPMDYDGAMGVPISFLDKHCPEQFEILGTTESEGKGLSAGLFKENGPAQPMIGGKKVYKRLFIRRKS